MKKQTQDWAKMEISKKYENILNELLQYVEEIKRKGINQNTFRQKIVEVINKEVSIPFTYSKQFEEFIRFRVIQIASKADEEKLQQLRIVIEQLSLCSYLSQDLDILLSLIDCEIDILQQHKQRNIPPILDEYQEHINKSIQKKINESSLLHNSQQFYFKQFIKTSRNNFLNDSRLSDDQEQFKNDQKLVLNTKYESERFDRQQNETMHQRTNSLQQQQNAPFIQKNNAQPNFQQGLNQQYNGNNQNMIQAQNIYSYNQQQTSQQNQQKPYQQNQQQIYQQNQQQIYQQQMNQNKQHQNNQYNQQQIQQNNQQQFNQQNNFYQPNNPVYSNNQNNVNNYNNIVNQYTQNNQAIPVQNNQMKQQQNLIQFNNQNQQQTNQQIQNQNNMFKPNQFQSYNQNSQNNQNNVTNNQNYFQQANSNQQNDYWIDQQQRQFMNESIKEANSLLFSSISQKQANNKKDYVIENEKYLDLDNDEIQNLSRFNQVDQELIKIYNTNIIKSEKKQNMLTFLNYVLKNIQQRVELKYYKVTLKANIFGSFFQGTSLGNDSDIDVIVNFENVNFQYKKALQILQAVCLHLFQEPEYKVEGVTHNNIRIPFITIHQKEKNLRIDLIYDNPLGVSNSKLFFTYINIDEKIRILSVLFKIWATNNNIKGKYTITSYALLNMILFFLMKSNYITSIQDGSFYNFGGDSIQANYYCYSKPKEYQIYPNFVTDIKIIRQTLFQKQQKFKEFLTKPLHELFIDLMKFYLNYVCDVENQMKQFITIRPIKQQGIDKSKWELYNKISIQDPFDDDYNPGSRNSFKLHEFKQHLQNVPIQLNTQNIKEFIFNCLQQRNQY